MLHHFILGTLTEHSKSEPSQSQAEETHHKSEVLQTWYRLLDALQNLSKQR